MTEYDLIECGFNAADETINFGARAIGDYKNLFETCTLASIKHSTDNVLIITHFYDLSCIILVLFQITCDEPQINSLVSDGKLYFSINKTFRIFKTLECDDVMFDTAFDENVDCFCVLPNAKLLFVCLRDGCIHGFCFEGITKAISIK